MFISAALNELSSNKLSSISDSDEKILYAQYRQVFVRFSEESGGKRKLKTITEDDAFFERLVDGRNPGNPDTPSQRRLKKAYDFFISKVHELGKDNVIELLDKLAQSTVMFYSVDTNEEATQIFELQNDRGKRLTDLEALKSYLMHGIYLYEEQNTESDLSHVQTNFAAIYRIVESIEDVFDAPAEDRILTYHCTAFEKWSDRDDLAKPKVLIRKQMEGIENNLDKIKWIKTLSHNLKETFDAVKQILSERDNYYELGDLYALGRTANYLPLLIKCWLLDKSDKKSNFRDTSRLIERFAFRAALAGKRSDYLESAFATGARDFKGDFIKLQEVIESRCNDEELKPKFLQGIDSESFYNEGQTALYFLWKYENHLRSETGNKYPAISWRSIRYANNKAEEFAKDHIEPQNSKRLDELVRWDLNNNSEEERKFSQVYLHRVGNLVLDTRSAGASKGYKPFKDRMENYQKSAFVSQGQLADYASQYNWTCESIRNRQKVLVEFAKSI